MSNSDDLFAEAMQQVKRIEITAKITTPKQPVKNKVRKDIHNKTRASSHALPTRSKSTLKEDASPWVLRANGVAPDVLKKLSSGQTSINHTIDLHGMTRDQALSALEQALQSSLQASDRVLCVIHGRGLHSPDGQPVLKNGIYQWLKRGPMSGYILAVTPAPNTAGGSCLILLRRDKHK